MKRTTLTAAVAISLAACSAPPVLDPPVEAAQADRDDVNDMGDADDVDVGFARSIPIAPLPSTSIAPLTSDGLRARLEQSGLLEWLRAHRTSLLERSRPAPRALGPALIPLVEPLGAPMYEAFAVSDLIEAGVDPRALVDLLQDLAPPTTRRGRCYGVTNGELVVNLRLSSLQQADRVLEALRTVLLDD